MSGKLKMVLCAFVFAAVVSVSLVAMYFMGYLDIGNDADAAISQADAVRISQTKETTIESIVFYTESGTVYHTDRSCSALKNSKAVLFGTVEDAQRVGKTKACSKCGG